MKRAFSRDQPLRTANIFKRKRERTDKTAGAEASTEDPLKRMCSIVLKRGERLR